MLIPTVRKCTVDNSHIFSASHCGYPAPGYSGTTFLFTPFFTVGSFSFTKPMLPALVGAVAVIAFFWAAFANPKIVPRGAQNLGEMGIELTDPVSEHGVRYFSRLLFQPATMGGWSQWS